jgi:ribose transport system ATP-binding protein
MSPTEPAAVETVGLGKHFGDQWVLRDFSMKVAPGEILGLVGENGSGKSTLVKILSGVHSPDAGQVLLAGEELSPHSGGVAVIHQDLGLSEDMSVLENLGISSGYGARLFAPISFRSERRLCRELLDSLGSDLRLDTLVADLTPAARSAIAVARSSRALAAEGRCRLLILDEPTAYLGRQDADRVLALVRAAADGGVGVIFISHDLDEVARTCDRIVVIRDGLLVDEMDQASVTTDRVIESMLGRPLDRFYPAPEGRSGDPILSFDHVTGGMVRDVSLDLKKGEILGVTGLVGSGYEDLPYLLAGLIPATSGAALLDGRQVLGVGIKALLELGVAIVPANRQRDGGWMDGSAQENVSLLRLGTFFRWPSLRSGLERDDSLARMRQFDVRPLAPNRKLGTFSGGNQQKLVLAKWFSLSPRVMLLAEPTQGVDAGARRDILELVAEAARQGNAVAIFSSDSEQLAEVCDRIAIIVNGELRYILPGSDATESSIVALAQA